MDKSGQEFVGKDAVELFFDPEDRDPFIAKVLRDDGVDNLERELQRADGSPIWILVTSQVHELDGKTTLVNWLHDITDRKEAERELAQKEELLSTALTSMSDGIYVLDSDLRYIMFNQRFLDLIEVARDKIRIGESVRPVLREMADLGFYGPGDPEELAEQRYAFMANNETAVLEAATPSGITLHIRQAPLSGGGVVIALTDITDRKQAERELAEKEALLSTALTSMSDGIYVLDSRLNYVMFNDRYLDLVEVASDIIKVGSPVRAVIRHMAEIGFYGPGDPVKQTDERCVNLAGRDAANIEVTTSSGNIVHVRKSPLADGGAVITLTDITESKMTALQLEAALAELKTAQANLIQSEKLASLGQLTAGIAHEIRNPLNFVNNFAKLSGDLIRELKETVETPVSDLDGDDQHDLDEILETLTLNFEQISEHGSRADRIVNSMLMHSRETKELQEVDCNQLVAEVLNLAFHSERAVNPDFDVTLEQDLDPADVSAVLLRQEISRVFINLLSNAFFATGRRAGDASQPGDYIPTVKIATRNLEQEIEIRVWDNGIGMNDEVMSKVFTPFFTTKSGVEGTGLGLSLSYDIVVRQHHGSITVDSRENEFTEFVVRLPREFSAEGAPHAQGVGR